MSESSSLLVELLSEDEMMRELMAGRQRGTCVPGAYPEPPSVPKSHQPGGEGRGPINRQHEGARRPGGDGVTGI